MLINGRVSHRYARAHPTTGRPVPRKTLLGKVLGDKDGEQAKHATSVVVQILHVKELQSISIAYGLTLGGTRATILDLERPQRRCRSLRHDGIMQTWGPPIPGFLSTRSVAPLRSSGDVLGQRLCLRHRRRFLRTRATGLHHAVALRLRTRHVG